MGSAWLPIPTSGCYQLGTAVGGRKNSWTCKRKGRSQGGNNDNAAFLEGYGVL